MADCAAPGCDRPIPDVAFVCAWSEADLAGKLHDAADLWPELELTAFGQGRTGDPTPSRGSPGREQPMPVRWTASIIAGTVRNTVTTWARLVVEEHGGSPPADTPALLQWLAGQLGWCRYQRWAAELWDELGYACGRITPAVDRPRPRVDAGLCMAATAAGPCQNRLSAPPRAAIVHCPVCRAVHSSTDRSATILAAAQDHLFTAEDAAALLTIHGLTTPSATIRSWANRRRLLSPGSGSDGRPLYPFSVVHRLRTEMLDRREKVGASGRSAA